MARRTNSAGSIAADRKSGTPENPPNNLSGSGFVFPALALAGLLAAWRFVGRDDVKAFLSSCAYLLGMLTSVVFGVYPYVLPASTNPAYSLTVHNAKAADYGLKVGLVWWVIGMTLATGYFVFAYRYSAGKVSLSVEEEGY